MTKPPISGVPKIRGIGPAARKELELAMERGYLVSRQRNSARDRFYWQWCRRSGFPFVLILIGQRWAKVDINLEPMGRRSPDAGDKMSAFLRQEGIERRGSGGRMEWNVEKLPADRAVELAMRLKEIALESSEPHPDFQPNWMKQFRAAFDLKRRDQRP